VLIVSVQIPYVLLILYLQKVEYHQPLVTVNINVTEACMRGLAMLAGAWLRISQTEISVAVPAVVAH